MLKIFALQEGPRVGDETEGGSGEEFSLVWSWFRVGRHCVLIVYTEGGKKRVSGFFNFLEQVSSLSGIWVLVVT